MIIGGKHFNPKNGRYYQYFSKCYWMLLYHYNSKTETPFTSSNVEFSYLNDKYSILGALDDSYRQYGKFEFLLEYPSLNLRNHWLQTANPITTQETASTGYSVDGYQAISVNMTTNHFGGLVKSTTASHTFLDGSTNCGNWYYSIGTYLLYDAGNYPGPEESKRVYESVLWIRAGFPFCSFKKCKNSYILLKELSMILLMAS